MPDGGFPLKVCRGCNRSSREVRFDPMSKHRCTQCADDQRQRRAVRIEARGPRVAEAVRDPDPGENKKHLAWIRRQFCAVHGPDCRGPIEAHHVRRETDGGGSLLPSDRWAIPLCHFHHLEDGHRHGWVTFEQKHGIDLRALAVRLAAASPHIKRERAKADG